MDDFDSDEKFAVFLRECVEEVGQRIEAIEGSFRYARVLERRSLVEG